MGGDESWGQVAAGLSLRPMRSEKLQFHYAYGTDPIDADARTTVGLEVSLKWSAASVSRATEPLNVSAQTTGFPSLRLSGSARPTGMANLSAALRGPEATNPAALSATTVHGPMRFRTTLG